MSKKINSIKTLKASNCISSDTKIYLWHSTIISPDTLIEVNTKYGSPLFVNRLLIPSFNVWASRWGGHATWGTPIESNRKETNLGIERGHAMSPNLDVWKEQPLTLAGYDVVLIRWNHKRQQAIRLLRNAERKTMFSISIQRPDVTVTRTQFPLKKWELMKPSLSIAHQTVTFDFSSNRSGFSSFQCRLSFFVDIPH